MNGLAINLIDCCLFDLFNKRKKVPSTKKKEQKRKEEEDEVEVEVERKK